MSVIQWLSRIERDWFIVFDNVTGDSSGLAPYLPQGDWGNILFTSRNLNSGCYIPSEAQVEVEGMEEEDAISLLLKSSALDKWSTELREAAKLIVKELCCLPLALDQAGAAIASGLCSIDDYLVRYSNYRRELLADPTFKGASNYGYAVYGAWDLSFKAIHVMGTPAAESAVFILQTFAFYHHEGIAEEIIKRAAEAGIRGLAIGGDDNGRKVSLPSQLVQLDQRGSWDPFFFREGIRVLLSYSLIKKGAISGIYSFHPLVHCWSRDRMSHEARQISSCLASTLLASSITFHFMATDYAFRRALIPHMKALEKCTTESGIQIPYQDNQCTKFALVYDEAGYWKEAEELWNQVMWMRKRILGEEHPDALAIIANLASTYQKQGRWKEAEELEVQVMQMRKNILGEDHLDTLTSMANLAATYWSQGHWNEAEELEVQVMQMRKNILGEEHPDTLTSMANLASTYQKQGHWKNAEELQDQVMRMGKNILGEEHPSTLFSIANLASTYQKQGWWKEAEELEVQVMQISKRVLGEEHPDTLTSMANLAATYWSQGHWNKTEELEVQVMQMRKNILGEEHPSTLTSMANLASAYQKQGWWKEAEELEVQMMQISKRVLGEEHPDTITRMANLASTYQNEGHWKQVVALEVEATQIGKIVHKEGHSNTLNMLDSQTEY